MAMLSHHSISASLLILQGVIEENGVDLILQREILGVFLVPSINSFVSIIS